MSDDYGVLDVFQLPDGTAIGRFDDIVGIRAEVLANPDPKAVRVEHGRLIVVGQLGYRPIRFAEGGRVIVCERVPVAEQEAADAAKAGQQARWDWEDRATQAEKQAHAALSQLETARAVIEASHAALAGFDGRGVNNFDVPTVAEVKEAWRQSLQEDNDA